MHPGKDDRFRVSVSEIEIEIADGGLAQPPL